MFAPFNRDGIGLHTGEVAQVRLMPGPSGSGICFVVEGYEIEAVPGNLPHDQRWATILSAGGRTVRTVEHLLAAIAATKERDLRILVDGPEIPILDGSAMPWYQSLMAAGASPGFLFVGVEDSIEVASRGAVARVTPLRPEERPSIKVIIDFEGWDSEKQVLAFYPTSDDFSDIAPARTFVLEKDVEEIRRQGLAKGGSLDNALVIGHSGPLNPDGTRFPDEPVRHKMLDAIGDFRILGGLPFAHVVLIRPGHHLLHELVRRMVPKRIVR